MAEKQDPSALTWENGDIDHSTDASELLDTTKVLQQFGKVKKRIEDKERIKKNSAQWQKWKQDNEAHEPTLTRLRAWAEFTSADKLSRLSMVARGKLDCSMPNDDDLESLAHHHFPCVSDVRVRIIDFGDGRTQKHDITLKEIDPFIREKPSWVQVRWIHARLGLGIGHSSLEEVFLDVCSRRGASQQWISHQGNSQAWPYQEIETINIRSKNEYRDMVDVYRILNSGHEAFASTQKRLDFLSEKRMGMNRTLDDNISWRSKFFGQKPYSYWDLAAAGMLNELTRSVTRQYPHPGPAACPQHSPLRNNFQVLWDEKLFENCQLVRDRFRCFHRVDECLLTMSSDTGIHYLDKNLPNYLTFSTEGREDCEDASVFAFLFKRFERSGTRYWPKKTVDWFMVYLLTEIVVTPHTLRQGNNTASLITAYERIVEKLKARKFEKFARNQSSSLVREILACTDELFSICSVFNENISLMENMLRRAQIEDAREHNDATGVPGTENSESDDDAEDEEDSLRCDSAIQRIQWALDLLNQNVKCFEALLADLRLITDTTYQLRSIEQNELAIIADIQNKAILVFTGVTIIFLPLSFFTGYFGMNLKGILSTPKDEKWFWKTSAKFEAFKETSNTAKASDGLEEKL